MILVLPLIIYVMMEKKYQLVAWTMNVTDPEKVQLRMIPSLEADVQAPFIIEISRCHRELFKNHGQFNLDLARRLIRAYEEIARFEFLTGHVGDCIRYLCFAAMHCIWEDDCNWAYHDTDLGSYSCFCGSLRHEFTRLCEEAISLAGKYRREDIFHEKCPRHMLELYFEHSKEEYDLFHSRMWIS